MEEEVQPIDNVSQQEGMPKIYKWLIIGIIVAVVLIAGLVIMKVFSMKQTSELKNYGMDFEGFVSQAKSCEPSKVLYNSSLNLLGLSSVEWTYELKLNGIRDGRCSFYMEIINLSVEGASSDPEMVKDFKNLNRSCNLPLELVELEFEYFKSGSPKAFSNESYCTYKTWITSGFGEVDTNDTFCEENWNCNNWSSCSNEQQTRTCIDLNNCGTLINRPQILRSCQQTQTIQESNECSGLPLWVQGSPNGTCTDSDNGKNFYIKGATSGPEWAGNSFMQEEDTCGQYDWNSNLLTEYFCCNGFLYIEEYTCPNGCFNGSCSQTARVCKTKVNNICEEYYLPDYFECHQKRDCTQPCENCSGGTQNCIDMGKWMGTGYDYSDYNHYYKCAECFGLSDDANCKQGYQCGLNKCEPNFETKCNLEVCENCVSSKRKYSSSEGFSLCYDCDTNADCKTGFICTMAECVAV